MTEKEFEKKQSDIYNLEQQLLKGQDKLDKQLKEVDAKSKELSDLKSDMQTKLTREIKKYTDLADDLSKKETELNIKLKEAVDNSLNIKNEFQEAQILKNGYAEKEKGITLIKEEQEKKLVALREEDHAILRRNKVLNEKEAQLNIRDKELTELKTQLDEKNLDLIEKELDIKKQAQQYRITAKKNIIKNAG